MGMYETLMKNKDLTDKIVAKGKTREFISTNVISMNLLFSGRVRGGIPKGKISQISADSSLGKCFFGDEKIIIYVNKEDHDNIKNYLENVC